MYGKQQISADYLFIVKPQVTLKTLRVECPVFVFSSAKRSLWKFITLWLIWNIHFKVKL